MSERLPPAWRRRLREVWRSAGWPCRDALEAELLAGGWLVEASDARGAPMLRLGERGLQALAAATAGHRRARGPHEALIDRVAGQLQREGRLVWRGLSLRAGLPVADDPPAMRWPIAQPDLFSLRPSPVETGLMPLAHEIKAHRSDLLSDLRRPDKAAAYEALAGACWYVLAEGIGDERDVPQPFGVMVVQGERLMVRRAPVRRAVRLSVATWVALARATPVAPPEEPWQPPLAPCGDEPVRV